MFGHVVSFFYRHIDWKKVCNFESHNCCNERNDNERRSVEDNKESIHN